MEPNLDRDLKEEKKLMVVLVLAQVHQQEIATPETVQVHPKLGPQLGPQITLKQKVCGLGFYPFCTLVLVKTGLM